MTDNIAARLGNLKVTDYYGNNVVVDDDKEDCVKRELMCPICLDYYKEPVILSCGHNFCHGCISLHWSRTADRNHGYECPQCRTVFTQMTLTKNFVVQNLVDRLDELDGLRGSAKVTSGQCDKHGEELKLYCQADKCRICVICRESRAHRHHEVFPVSEVVGDMKAMLESKLEELTWHRTQCEKVKMTEECDKTQAMNMKKNLREKIEADVGHLVQFLLNTRDSMLDKLDADEEATIQAINNNLSRVEAQLAAVNTEIATIHSHLTGETSFESLAETFDKTLHSKPMKTPAVTEWPVIWPELSDPFQLIIWKNLMRALHTKPQNLTLDPYTAHPGLLITEDGTKVEETDLWLDEDNLSQRFNRFFGVLALDRFSSGQRYWEVDVKDKSVWYLGVASEVSGRKGFVSLKPSSGYWTLSLQQGQLVSNQESGFVPLGIKRKLAPRRVGVFLDYDGGRVSFYDAVDMVKLYDFDAFFDDQTVYPFFSPGKGDRKGQFQICHYY